VDSRLRDLQRMSAAKRTVHCPLFTVFRLQWNDEALKLITVN
jgi:hypothetical protein